MNDLTIVKNKIMDYFTKYYTDFKVFIKETNYSIFFNINKEEILFDEETIKTHYQFMNNLIFEDFENIRKSTNKGVILFAETDKFFKEIEEKIDSPLIKNEILTLNTTNEFNYNNDTNINPIIILSATKLNLKNSIIHSIDSTQLINQDYLKLYYSKIYGESNSVCKVQSYNYTLPSNQLHNNINNSELPKVA